MDKNKLINEAKMEVIHTYGSLNARNINRWSTEKVEAWSDWSDELAENIGDEFLDTDAGKARLEEAGHEKGQPISDDLRERAKVLEARDLLDDAFEAALKELQPEAPKAGDMEWAQEIVDTYAHDKDLEEVELQAVHPLEDGSFYLAMTNYGDCLHVNSDGHVMDLVHIAIGDRPAASYQDPGHSAIDL